jgi:hypothetical protein
MRFFLKASWDKSYKTFLSVIYGFLYSASVLLDKAQNTLAYSVGAAIPKRVLYDWSLDEKINLSAAPGKTNVNLKLNKMLVI